MAKKKNQNQTNVPTEVPVEDYKQAGIRHGIAGGEVDEAVPRYERAPAEKIISGRNNSMIIFGRDRPSVRMSGYGGKGGTQCAKIDLVAGLASSMTPDGPPNSNTMVSTNFALDASRIYISQKADIDAYMGITETSAEDSKASAAIGIKSDCVRIFGRKNIKIVTGKSRFQGLGDSGELNAQGGKQEVPGTISFIAGNYAESELKQQFEFISPSNKVSKTTKKLQPLVKGDNLVEFLNEVMGHCEGIIQQVQENTMLITQLSIALAAHNHFIPFSPPIPTTPSPTLAPIAGQVAKRGLEITVTHIPNLLTKSNFTKQNFLKEMSPVYINSKHVYTT